MINFGEKVRIIEEADKSLDEILSKKHDILALTNEVSKITDLEVAKVIIKNLVNKL